MIWPCTSPKSSLLLFSPHKLHASHYVLLSLSRISKLSAAYVLAIKLMPEGSSFQVVKRWFYLIIWIQLKCLLKAFPDHKRKLKWISNPSTLWLSPVFLPGESHGRREPVTVWGRKVRTRLATSPHLTLTTYGTYHHLKLSYLSISPF